MSDLLMVEDKFKSKTGDGSSEKVRRLLEEMDSLSPEELVELERQKALRRKKNG